MIIALALLLLLLAAAPAQAADATGFQANAARDGLSAEPGLQPPLGQRWSKDLGGGTASYPVVTDGVVAVSVPKGAGAAVIALDAATGASVWTRTVAGDSVGPPRGLAAA